MNPPRVAYFLKGALFGSLFFLSIIASASDNVTKEAPVVKSEVDKAFVTIGEKINYEISVQHSTSTQIKNIDAADTLRFFEVKEWNKFSTKKGKDVVDGKRFVITNFELGEFVLAPAKITYQDEAGNEQQILSNTLYVTVESVDKGTKAKDDILGVKGVVRLKNIFTSRSFLVFFIIALAILSAIWFVYLQKKKSADHSADENLLPHEEAYQALARLADSDLIQNGFYASYFAGISEILRRYFERRYHFLALESTTEEVMRKIRELDLDGKTKTLIKSLLEMCDLAKFAKYRPSPAEVTLSNQQAKEVIDLTKEIVITEPAQPAKP